jgi:hypothetical protein
MNYILNIRLIANEKFHAIALVDMGLEGITPKGKLLVNRINKECDYTTTKPDYLK